MVNKRLILVTVFVVAGGAGCTNPLPRHPWVGSAEAMAAMGRRAVQIETVSATGRLLLSSADGQDTQLDCAMVYRRPDQFRIRAWKFSHAVFDVTMKGEALWLFVSNSKGRGNRSLPDAMSTEHIAQAWSLIISGFPLDSWKPCQTNAPDRFAVCSTSGGTTKGVECEIDRSTLTTQRCSAHDEQGAELFRLTPERYRRYGDVVMPTRVRASTGGHAFTWQLDEIEVNQVLASHAFVPPRRAVKQP